MQIERRIFDEVPGDGTAAGGTGDSGAAGSITDWRAGLPEQVREWDEVKQSDAPEKFWDQMSHLRSKVGTGIYPPDEQASPEARQAFLDKIRKQAPELMPTPDPTDPDALNVVYDALGRPTDPTEYQLPENDVPEGVNLQSDQIAQLKGLFHKHGATQKQFEGIVGEMLKADVEKASGQQASFTESLHTLRGEWGAAYDTRLSAINKLVETTGAPAELVDGVKQNAVSAKTLKWLYGLSQLGKEGKALSVDESDASVLTPNQAKDQISKIMDDKKHPYWNPAHPMHRQAKARMRELRLAEVHGENVEIQLGAGAVHGGTIGT